MLWSVLRMDLDALVQFTVKDHAGMMISRRPRRSASAQTKTGQREPDQKSHESVPFIAHCARSGFPLEGAAQQ
ncbi:MAG: hypothetical protein B7X36_09180 [Thiomonas sp. 14-64-326]|nr:MAG: hypothetical protein B7X36_09180 [Thiomonas sp. 14-64-326]